MSFKEDRIMRIALLAGIGYLLSAVWHFVNHQDPSWGIFCVFVAVLCLAVWQGARPLSLMVGTLFVTIYGAGCYSPGGAALWNRVMSDVLFLESNSPEQSLIWSQLMIAALLMLFMLLHRQPARRLFYR
jgi:hypothetical protein